MLENMPAIILTQNLQNFYSFCYFGIGSVSFYSLRLKIINVIYKMNAKKEGKRFGYIWGPSSVP